MKIRIIRGAATVLATTIGCVYLGYGGDFGFGTVDFSPCMENEDYRFSVALKAGNVFRGIYHQKISFYSDLLPSEKVFYEGNVDGSGEYGYGEFAIPKGQLDKNHSEIRLERGLSIATCWRRTTVELRVGSPFEWKFPGEAVREEPSSWRAHIDDNMLYGQYSVPVYYGREYHFSGFEPLLEADSGRVALSSLRIYGTDEYHYRLPVRCRAAYLSILTNAEDFSIGEDVLGLNGGKGKRIPLSLEDDGKGESHLELAERYYIDVNTKKLRKIDGEMKNGEIICESLYLPNDDKHPEKTYVMRVEIEGFSNLSTSRVVYDFEVKNSKRYFGGCMSSTYCVGIE